MSKFKPKFVYILQAILLSNPEYWGVPHPEVHGWSIEWSICQYMLCNVHILATYNPARIATTSKHLEFVYLRHLNIWQRFGSIVWEWYNTSICKYWESQNIDWNLINMQTYVYKNDIVTYVRIV